MNLKEFFDNKESAPEPYWSLVIEPNWVQAGIWRVGSSKKIQVEHVSSPVKWELDSELVDACDSVLSSSIGSLSEGSKEPSKTVFGVSSSWVVGGEIKSEYLEKIKNICEKLSLVPAGFVVLTEAVSHLLKHEEGVSPNCVVVGIYEVEIEVSVFSLGNLLGTTIVSRSVSIVEDVVEGLTRLSSPTPFPSRIVIFDGKEGQLNEAKDSLLSKNWDDEEKIKFLHSPKVEILDTEKKVLAVSLAGASEIEGVEGLEVSSEHDNLAEAPTETKTIADEFGFSEIVEEEKQETEIPGNFPTINTIASSTNEHPVAVVNENNFLPRRKPLLNMGNLPKFNFKVPSIPKFKLPKIGFILASIVGLFLLLMFYWWYFGEATISLYVAPRKITKDILLDLNGNSREIAGSYESEKTTNTSGKKLVGDRSKGSVKIQNGTNEPISITASTVLLSSGDLRFTVDESVTIPGATSPSSPGTGTVAVTASAIGSEYNLAKDEVFKVGNYPKSDVDATSISDFSGGSSREVSAVSNSDLSKLEAELRTEVEEKIKSDLSTQINEDEVVSNTALSTTDVVKEFSKKSGDEADNVSLKLKVEGVFPAIKKQSLLDKINSEIQNEIPSGYVVRSDQIDYEFGSLQDDNEKLEVKAIINLLPEVNEEEFKEKVKGKKTEVVDKYIENFESYTKAYIVLKPKVLSFFGSLPKLVKNITIEIIADR